MAPPARRSQKTTISSPSTPFVFRRSKLKIEPITVTKEVRLRTTYPSKEALEDALHSNIPVSTSGRTLGIALSLSHPEDLASYSIDAMKDGAWKKVEVTYSRPGPDNDLVERVRCLEKEVAQTNAQMKQMNAQIKQMNDELKAKRTSEEDLDNTTMQWQTAQSVFNAYGKFAWSLLSKTEHNNLARFGIHDFAELFYAKPDSDHPSAMAAANRALGLLPSTISQYSYTIIAMKSGVSDRPHKHAHPQISEECLEEFLDAIGLSRGRSLSSLEFSLIRHLKATARKPLKNP